MSNTKELIVNFGNDNNVGPSVAIDDKHVEIVDSYKYLGSVIDNKLKGDQNLNRITKKARQRLFFLRKLNYVKVNNKILTLFYTSIIQSVITFCIICWYGNAGQCDLNALDRIIKSARKMGCTEIGTLNELYYEYIEKKTIFIMSDTNHPLHKYFRFLPSGIRLNSIYCRTERLKKSFVPSAIRRFNKCKT